MQTGEPNNLNIYWLIVISLGFTIIITGNSLAAGGDEGEELYQFRCSTCHGDRGQGMTDALTDEWRATWPPGEQNCWQSKCHALNHPPEGFTFPKTVPAIVGDGTLTRFRTAQELYHYIRTTMPYHSPNLLSDDAYRAITLFIVEANYAAKHLPAAASLSQNLAAVPLHPAPEQENPSGTPLPWLSCLERQKLSPGSEVCPYY